MSLTVSIKNFRKWENHTFNIPLNGVTLLKGKSGSGKTTLLNCIYWGLYGTLKKISPNGNPKAVTEVTLIFPEAVIYRANHPNRLTITAKQGDSINRYEDLVAQQLICYMFGNSEVWQTSCYVLQGERNLFLSMNNNSKMDLLNAIAFHEENPAVKIDKLQQLIREQKNINQRLNDDFERQKAIYQSLPTENFDQNKILSEQLVQQYKQNLLSIDQEISTTTEQLNRKKLLLEQLANYQDKISLLQPPEKPQESQQLLSLSLKINKDLDYPQLFEQYQKVKNVIERFSVDKIINRKITEQDANQARQQEQKYYSNLSICQAYKVDYKPSAIDQEINRVSTLVENQFKYKSAQTVKELSHKISAIHIQDYSETFTPEDLTNCIKQEEIYQRQLDLCQKLNIPYDKEIIEQEQATLNYLLSNQTAFKNFQQAKQLQAEIDQIVVKNYSHRFDQSDYYRAVDQRRSYNENIRICDRLGIKYDEKVVSDRIRAIEEVINYLQYQEIKNSIDKLEKPVEPEKLDIQVEQQKQQAIEQQITEIQAKIPVLQLMSRSLKCPHCTKAVLYREGTLATGQDPSEAQQEQERIKRQLVVLQAQLLEQKQKVAEYHQIVNQYQKKLSEYESKISVLNYQLDKLQVPKPVEQLDQLLLENNIPILQKKLADLQTIVFSVVDYDPEYVQQVLDNQNQAEKRQYLIAQLEKLKKLNLLEGPVFDDLQISSMQRRLYDLQTIIYLPVIKYSSKYISQVLDNQRLQKEKENLVSQLNYFTEQEYLEGEVLEPDQLKYYHQLLHQLSNLEVIDLPSISSQMLNDSLEYQRNQQLLQQLETILNGLTLPEYQNYQIMLEDFSSLTKQYQQQLLCYQNNYQTLTGLITELEQQINRLQGNEEKLAEMNNQRNQWRFQIDEHYRCSQIYQEYQKLTQCYNALTNSVYLITKAERLLKILLVCECQGLEDTVNCLNASMMQSLQELFEQEMSVSLELFKTNKTTGDNKPTVNFVINYANGSYDNINQLSGGEGDRVSLAVTMAFNKLSNFPLLILDETLASLDQELKNEVISALAANSDHGVLIVMHEGIEGVFDHIVEL